MQLDGGSSICDQSTTAEEACASNAAAQASANTTAKESGASNTAGRAFVSTTAKEARAKIANKRPSSPGGSYELERRAAYVPSYSYICPHTVTTEKWLGTSN
jgi:hypothetical protein